MLKPLVYLQNTLTEVLRRDRGATAVEYGLIVFLIAAAIAGVLLTLGQNLGTVFGNIANKV